MPHVPGLRSTYARVGGLVYFGRMCDKIRLHAAGCLPADYHENFGRGFDARAAAFLRVTHADLVARVTAGGDEEEILAWALAHGGPRSEAERAVWNAFMQKRGWRDDSSALLRERIADYGLAAHPIETWFDLIEFDEGRDPVATRAWEQV